MIGLPFLPLSGALLRATAVLLLLIARTRLLALTVRLIV